MTKIWILAAVAMSVLAVVLLPHLWQPIENGPNLNDPSALIGCYGSGPERVALTRDRAIVVATRQSTPIVRFFYLKNDAAINTINNLEYDASGNSLRVGRASTGFFYRFDRPSNPSALLIPDDNGNSRALPRVPC